MPLKAQKPQSKGTKFLSCNVNVLLRTCLLIYIHTFPVSISTIHAVNRLEYTAWMLKVETRVPQNNSEAYQSYISSCLELLTFLHKINARKSPN